MSAKPRSKRDWQKSKPEWKKTWLWKTLADRARKSGNDGASEFLSTLEGWMKLLDGVLSSGGTAQLDFTLHDDGHSLRVANRIEQLVTASVQRNISDYELALLLLAAYGHDIGMTAERKKVEAHHRHLFDPEHSKLTQAEKDQFQKFLDDYHDRPISLPLCTGARTGDDDDLAAELTAFYIRDRHNDWSADWIRGHLIGNLHYLADTTETLVRLCQSHHWGFERLKESDFDPRPVGHHPPQIVHLRYLACLLRLADILENDPERTPEVIFRHRSMDERKLSVVHWQKDHDLVLDLQGDHIRFKATPRSARVHKALLQLADWIDHELHGIAAFGEKLPDHYRIGRDNIRREWHLAPALKRHIEPAPGTYEYIDGAFRPNTQRLLQLLSGEQLYGEPLAAVRELLQNAFDAVREKIARRRLESHVKNPADRALEKQYGDEEHVTLTLQRREVKVGGKTGTEHWLVCEDSGVGLTKALITGHLLVSGQSRRHDIMALERRCEEKGFRLGRTGQFGIGVLSYFMLASEVRLATVRFQACGDQDSVGWSFATHGVGDFGELKKLDRSPVGISGTRVELRLRPDAVEDSREFTKALVNYLGQTLLRIPCTFRFRIEGFAKDVSGWERSTGWTRMAEDHLAFAKSDWKEPENLKLVDEPLLSREHIEAQVRFRELYPGWLEQAKSTLRCATREIELPDGLGRALLILPYFELPDGRSLAYLYRDEAGLLPHPVVTDQMNYEARLLPRLVERHGWKGIDCQMEFPEVSDEENPFQLVPMKAMSLMLDFERLEDGALHVSRDQLKIQLETQKMLANYIRKHADVMAREVLSLDSPSFYYSLNQFFWNRRVDFVEGSAWLQHEEMRTGFRKIAFPLASMGFQYFLGGFRDSQDRVLFPASLMTIWLARNGMGKAMHQPTHVKVKYHTLGGRRQPIPVAVWEQSTAKHTDDTMPAFPPSWGQVAVCKFTETLICLNPAYPLYSLISKEQRHILLTEPIQHHKWGWEELKNAQSPSEAAWLLYRIGVSLLLIKGSSREFQYVQNNPMLLMQVWRLAGNTAELISVEGRMFLVSGHYVAIVSLLQLHGGDNHDPALAAELPKVTGEEWILRPEKGDGQETV